MFQYQIPKSNSWKGILLDLPQEDQINPLHQKGGSQNKLHETENIKLKLCL